MNALDLRGDADEFTLQTLTDTKTHREDRIVFKLMKKSVKQEGKHYILPLPWRPNVVLPCDNQSVAERRLASLKKPFLKR